MHRFKFVGMTFLAVSAVALVGCGDGGDDHGNDHGHDHGHDHAHHDEHGDDHADADGDAHGHHHTAPHGGTLIALGDHFAHAEVKVDAEMGVMTLWLLDGEAQAAVRSPLRAVDMMIQPLDDAGKPTLQSLSVSLQPVAKPLTCETVGDTSQFQSPIDDAASLQRFEATIKMLLVKGTKLPDVKFRYPEGNE